MFNKELVFSEKFQEDFTVKPVNIHGEDCVLVYPKAFPKWNEENKIYRSSIWRLSDGKPISLSYKKFCNWGEAPEFETPDFKNKIEFIQKIDGSCLISSKFNGNVIHRTRQTTNAFDMANGSELPQLLQQYSKVFDNDLINSGNFTILTEWYSPQNVIVLREATEPKLWLTGIVVHSDYSYLSQDKLDELALEWGIERPKRYNFNTFEEMEQAVSQFQTCEGIVAYFNNNQILKKIKAIRYLYLHKIKSNLNTQEAILDLFLSSNCETYSDFEYKITTDFDYEVFVQIRSEISKIFDAKKEVENIIQGMVDFVRDLQGLTRKEQALKIVEAYSSNKQTSFVFTLLDKKPISTEMLKKLYCQIMKIN